MNGGLFATAGCGMLLAIDIGNSNIVIGCMADGSVRNVFRMVTDAFKTEDEYIAKMRQILDFNNITPSMFDGAIISSVVPPLTGVFRAAVARLTGLESVVVGAGIKTGLNILIENPAELASDIVAVAVAAAAKYPPPIVMVDMGTATKIFVINAAGAFIGGAICPGIGLSADTLASGTALLPKVSIEAPKNAIRGDTVGAMRSGIVFGAAAMVDGMIDRFEKEIGHTASLVATGGYSHCVIPHCKRAIDIDGGLLLTGLHILYEKNRIKSTA